MGYKRYVVNKKDEDHIPNQAVNTVSLKTPIGYKETSCVMCGGKMLVEKVGQLAPHKPFYCIMWYTPMYKCQTCGHLAHVPRDAYIFEEE
jgi:hypothetical protein